MISEAIIDLIVNKLTDRISQNVLDRFQKEISSRGNLSKAQSAGRVEDETQYLLHGDSFAAQETNRQSEGGESNPSFILVKEQTVSPDSKLRNFNLRYSPYSPR